MLATECIQSSFEFAGIWSRSVTARFDRGKITSHGGALLLRQVEQRIHLLSRFSDCFLDSRDQTRVQHSVCEMLSQRIYGLALGYEDLNDHEQLREDPILMLVSGSAKNGAAAGGQEHAESSGTRWSGFVRGSLQASALPGGGDRRTAGEDLSGSAGRSAARDGDRSGCDRSAAAWAPGTALLSWVLQPLLLLALYILCGDHLLGVRLRPANLDASAGSLEEIERIVRQIRQAWPQTRIILRADSGFCRDSLMSWCEANQVGISVRLCTERAFAEDHRAADAGSRGPVSAYRPGSTRVHGVRLPDPR